MRSRTLSNTQPAGIQHKSSVTSNVPAITASSCATPLEHDTCSVGGTQPPQMREYGATLRRGKACQINDHFVETLLQQMLINLPQKRPDVESPSGDRPHRIVGHPLSIDPVIHTRWITLQRPHTLL